MMTDRQKMIVRTIFFVVLLVFLVVMSQKDSGYEKLEQVYKHKYDSIALVLTHEKFLRETEQKLRLKAEERIALKDDSIKQVQKKSELLLKKEIGLKEKYKKLAETVTNEELTEKLDSAFSN